MIDKILIYEVHFSNINRYVVPLAQYLIEKSIANEVVIVYDSFVKNEKIDLRSTENILHRNVKKEFADCRKRKNDNIVFLNYSYRIADLYWTSKFKGIGVYCCQVQHGMYAEFLERSFLGYFSTMGRKLTYLTYMLAFLLKFKVSVFVYLLNKDFMKSFKINNIIEKHKTKIHPVLSDHVFVWGDYWKEWFIINHYYNGVEEFTTIGNPDYHTFIKGSKNEMQKDKVCYIAQTFVEDGRMDKSVYKKVIDELSNALKERLIIKLHPRSDKSIFENVIVKGGEITYDFPITGFYVGHYSSVLALAINVGTKVFLLEINNEEIPEYFRNSANKVFPDLKQLLKAIEIDDELMAKQQISYYFQNIEQHPFEIIADKILKIKG